MKLLQDRPRKDLPKNSWDFFTYISKDQLKSAPPEREQSDTHKVPTELQFSHRHNPQCREGCRSHVKIRTADNESNLTRTKCREGYGENAAPRIQHPHLTPAMNTYHKNPCGHTVWGKMDWAYPPVNQAGLTEIRGAPVFPPQTSAPFPRNLATLGRASRSKPSARPRAVPPFLTMVDQHWGYEYGIIIGFHGNPSSEYWDTWLPIWDINGTLGAYWLKYTQMNGFINNQRDMNMGF